MTFIPSLKEHVCFCASFETSANAEFCRGNGEAKLNADVARHDAAAGRYGGALVFSAKDHGWDEDECTFSARDNFPYREDGGPFSGTVSLWLKGDPDADLADEFPVDPFHISRHSADGSFYLDLTHPNDWRYGSPRKLRFGFYNDSPAQDMFQNGRLLVVGDLNWNDSQWHHLVATWKNVNTGRADGSARIYIDGVLRGTMDGYEHRLSWDLDQLTIGLGQRYVGAIDELLILDCALEADEVQRLNKLDGPVARLL
jgi:hypothetical protein